MLFGINATARIVRDIEIRYTQEGLAIASTAVVKSRKWKDKKTGELREDTCFIDIAAFGQTAEHMNQYFGKGDLIEFDGELQQDKWEDKDGNKRNKHSIKIKEVDFGPCKKSENGGGGYTPKDPSERGAPVDTSYSGVAESANTQTQQAQESPKIPEIDIDEDEIPF